MDVNAELSGVVFIVTTLVLGVIVLAFARREGVRGLEAPLAGALPAHELDPMVKADLYLARGWRAQARATLEEAARADPLREDVRRKIAGIG